MMSNVVSSLLYPSQPLTTDQVIVVLRAVVFQAQIVVVFAVSMWIFSRASDPTELARRVRRTFHGLAILCFEVALLSVACSWVAVLRPWAYVLPWLFAISRLPRRLRRGRYAPAVAYAAPFSAKGRVNGSPVTLVVDEGRPCVTPTPFDLAAYMHPDAGVVRVSGHINPKAAQGFADACRRAAGKPLVFVEVNSTGGEVDAAREMFAALTMLVATTPTVVLVTGQCASAASTLIMAVAPENRYASRQARFMLHAASGGTEDALEHVNTHWTIDLLSKGTRIARASLREMVDSRQDIILTAEEAVELGLISRIVP